MKAAILSVACLAGLGLSATSAKAGTFDIVVRYPSVQFAYIDPYSPYYPSVYSPYYYPPAVIQTAPIVVAPRVFIPIGGYPRLSHYPLPAYPYGHRRYHR